MPSKEIFKIHKPGVLTTFQDMGRTGYQRFGVPVSGAMDTFALQIANILIGNPRDDACLEVTLIGPELEACQQVTLAITGADLQPMVNGRSVPMWKSFYMKKGDCLTFGRHQSGVRSYIAVAGGFEVPINFESKSTDSNSGFGEILKKGETIDGYHTINRPGIGLANHSIPLYKKSIDVAVIEGPHSDYFTERDRKIFFQTAYTVGANSNRMGYCLQAKNAKIEPLGEIWSDATPFGGIQIPPNGQPIILMADRQTTGGYPRIGTVISCDLPKVAQLPPQGTIRFHSISVAKAQQRAIEMESFLFCLEKFRHGLGE
ncbi:biotin-dependent carboxyltransferase family protein [Lentibacillus sp. Marseille-P4043]|uniref:5-oxoprolinase subunit C family protein n=1 Tax=Lentibacillus sp. Marseille-P4043 TaxID=2040293 RepID=UPI000D0B88C0|nr:biotin-dependent carboxyltransferase family protein [Lentibacillus sp. Marseille-P4043]